MRIRHDLPLAATLLIAATSTGFAADGTEGQVKEAYAAWDAAFNAGNAEDIGALYTDDATLVPQNNEVIEGPSGVAEFFSGVLGAGFTDHTLEPITIVDGEAMVSSASRWTVQGKDESGEPVTYEGTAVQTFEKQDDGSLKLRLHSFH